ncbi:hypothetical protein chiPu_0026702, partial [Chiloscyllium punctatum]|nr:hypothetical protein [Chiloscyllium punctatum]
MRARAAKVTDLELSDASDKMGDPAGRQLDTISAERSEPEAVHVEGLDRNVGVAGE